MSKPPLPVTSVIDMVNKIEALYHRYGSSEYEWYYRGEWNIGWKVEPSIERDEYREEGMMLTDLRAHQPDKFVRYSSAFSHWVLAQHHGLPTRLLDVTKKPLVALFFACYDMEQQAHKRDTPDNVDGVVRAFGVPRERVKSFNSDTVSIASNFARLRKNDQDQLLGEIYSMHGNQLITTKTDFHFDSTKTIIARLYGLIKEEKPGFVERINRFDFVRVLAVNPEQSFDRIRAQSGAFFISCQNMSFIEDEEVSKDREYKLHSTRVDGQQKGRIIEELDHLGITYESLFPELEASSKAIKEKYLVDMS